MDAIRDWLNSWAGEAGGPVIFSALAFLLVFLAALVLGRRFLLPTKTALPDKPADDLTRGAAKTVLLNGRVLARSAGPGQELRMQLGSGRPDPLLGAKRVMKKIFRVVSAVFVGGLLILTFLAYQASRPGTGDILLPIVLAVVTLMISMHLLQVDSRHNVEPDPGLREEIDQMVQAELGSKIQAALSGAVPVEWNFASPEVHRIDNEGLALARAMSDEGKPMDEICRVLEADYAGWSPPHQQAFRNVMQAALDHS